MYTKGEFGKSTPRKSLLLVANGGLGVQDKRGPDTLEVQIEVCYFLGVKGDDIAWLQVKNQTQLVQA